VAEEFFSNRELYELFQSVAKEMNELKAEMRETRAIIRGYNGLRKKVDEVDEKVDKISAKTYSVDTKVKTLMWVVGVGIPVMSLLIAFLNYLKG